jgi:antitoxin component of RelBE/YafQ-DinJ toxin-antitoxin module
MTNLKDVHLRLDEESKAQWMEVVELMGETMQSQAFRLLIKDKYNELNKNCTKIEELINAKSDENGI